MGVVATLHLDSATHPNTTAFQRFLPTGPVGRWLALHGPAVAEEEGEGCVQSVGPVLALIRLLVCSANS